MQPVRRTTADRLRRQRMALGWAVASFVVLQVGLALGIERWLPEFRDPLFAIKERRLATRLACSGHAPSVVVLGSSHVEEGLIGHAVEEQLAATCGIRPVVFNFGIAGGGPLTELLTMRRLLADGIRPDHVLIEVVPPLLAAQVPSSEFSRLTPQRLWLSELSLIARFGPSLAELHAEWWQEWPVPWYSHRYAILACVAPRLLPNRVSNSTYALIDEAGDVPLRDTPPTPDAYQYAVAHERQAFAPYFADFRLGGPGCDALRELVALCRQERIDARLLLMPQGKPFRNLYTPEVWAQIESFLQGLCREFDLSLIDARDWIADEHFSDAHHLIGSGASQFTERLGREHLVPLLDGHVAWPTARDRKLSGN